MPSDIHLRLEMLRQYRIFQARYAGRALAALDKACHGMSTKRATDRGGTGTCPLTDYALAYAEQRDLAAEYGQKADEIWSDIKKHIQALEDFDARQVITLFYYTADPWEDVRKKVKRSMASVFRLHNEAIKTMERM